MNPLNHFGIKKQFIRGDTKSYNYSAKELLDMTEEQLSVSPPDTSKVAYLMNWSGRPIPKTVESTHRIYPRETYKPTLIPSKPIRVPRTVESTHRTYPRTSPGLLRHLNLTIRGDTPSKNRLWGFCPACNSQTYHSHGEAGLVSCDTCGTMQLRSTLYKPSKIYKLPHK